MDYDIFFINLDTATKRRKNCEKNFPKSVRIPGVNGKELTIEDRHEKKILQNVSDGVAGCFLSHIAAWEKVSKSDKPWSIIIEDDYNPPDNFTEEVQNIINELPENWDLVNLYYYKFPRLVDYYVKLQGFDTTRSNYSKSLIKRGFNLSSCCYMVSKKGVTKLLDYYQNNGIKNHVDKIVNRVDLIKFCARDPIGKTNSRVFDSLTTQKRPYVFNKIMDDFRNISSDVSDAWFLSESDYKYGSFEINCWFGIFLIMGLLSGFLNMPFISKFLIFVFLIDALITRDIKGVGVDITTVLISFMTGYLIRL